MWYSSVEELRAVSVKIAETLVESGRVSLSVEAQLVHSVPLSVCVRLFNEGASQSRSTMIFGHRDSLHVKPIAFWQQTQRCRRMRRVASQIVSDDIKAAVLICIHFQLNRYVLLVNKHLGAECYRVLVDCALQISAESEVISNAIVSGIGVLRRSWHG
jgi:hypothetical protein